MILYCPVCDFEYDPEERSGRREYSDDPDGYLETFRESVPFHHQIGTPMMCDGSAETPLQHPPGASPL